MNRATSSTKQSFVAEIKVAYVGKQSTTTIIVWLPSNLGRLMMKSMEMLSHGCFGTDRGSKSPAADLCSDLSYWHTRQVLTYVSTSSCILGQKYQSLMRVSVQ